MTDSPSVCALLFSGEDSRGVDDRNPLEDGRVSVGALEPVEEGVTKLGQRSELFLWVDDQGVAWNHALVVLVHHGNEPVGCRLRTDTDSRKVMF